MVDGLIGTIGALASIGGIAVALLAIQPWLVHTTTREVERTIHTVAPGRPALGPRSAGRRLRAPPARLPRRPAALHLPDRRRRILVGGCAGDPFLLAYGLDWPFTVEATCPATRTPIRVRFTGDGVTAQPAETVLALIHPDTPTEAAQSADPKRIDADICLHQPFYAGPDAAAGWLATHPGGQIQPVDKATYHDFRDLLGAGRYRQTDVRP